MTMDNRDDNRKRAFAEVVSIEAWHKAFGNGTSQADLHADVVFGTARVGGDTASPVRFRLRVKRADVVVIIPETEPVSVAKQSVSRDAPQLRAHLSKVTEQSTESSVTGIAKAKASTAGVDLSITASGSAGTRAEAKQKIEVSGDLGAMIVTQSRTSDGHYRWTIVPAADTFLDGRPWVSNDAPRLKLVDQRKDKTRGIPPAVRVEVRCRREDIDISDIRVKDETIWEAARTKIGFQNRIKAAEAYIRDSLAREGLEVGDLNDIFGELTFASTTAEPIS